LQWCTDGRYGGAPAGTPCATGGRGFAYRSTVGLSQRLFSPSDPSLPWGFNRSVLVPFEAFCGGGASAVAPALYTTPAGQRFDTPIAPPGGGGGGGGSDPAIAWSSVPLDLDSLWYQNRAKVSIHLSAHSFDYHNVA
jgi:hypothetical protein